MTNKEAIAVLENDAEYMYSQDSPYCREAYQMAVEALKSDPQKAYEQGVKDTLDKYDESCRIASYISVAIGCKTGKECWELIHNGEIQRVKHGQWVWDKENDKMYCSECGYETDNWGVHQESDPIEWQLPNYCENCGADMREVAE